MFSPTSNTRTVSATWRVAVWRAVDRAVAFATLDGYGLPDPRSAIDTPGARHPREPLRTIVSRRPAPVPRAHHCTAPLPARSRRHSSSELTRASSAS